MGRPWQLAAALAAIAAVSLAAAWLARIDRRAASAQTVAGVSFSPPSSTLVLGATPVPTIDVSVANAASIGGYDAWVTFNPAVVQLNGLQDAGFLANPNAQGTPQNPVLCNTPTITAGYGYLSCAILPLPSPFPPPVPPSAGSTPVALVHVSFSPLAVGTSALSLTAVASGTPQTTALFDVSGTPIASSLGAGAIAVSGASPSVGGIAMEPDVASLPPGPASDHLVRDLSVTSAVAAGAALLSLGAFLWFVRRRA